MRRRLLPLLGALAVVVAVGALAVAVPRFGEPSPDPDDVRTFAELFTPYGDQVVPRDLAVVEASGEPPSWFDDTRLVRWDTPGAFTHSLDPEPFGTLASSISDTRPDPAKGAEYVAGNTAYKNADVEFRVTARRFAIRYTAVGETDAMVWLDRAPTAAEPFAAAGTPDTGSPAWIEVTLPERRTVTVRFAGPITFTGVDAPASEGAVVQAVDPGFTIGVVSDSFFEAVPDPGSFSRSPAPTLRSLTGVRIWNMAQGDTGYLNDGAGAGKTGGYGWPGHVSSVFGSDRRLAEIADAPIDALLVNGSTNDGVPYTGEEHLRALDAFLVNVARLRPDLPVVIVGIEPFEKPDTRVVQGRQFRAMTNNFIRVARTHDNVVGFIDPYTEDWLTGTGTTTDPAGDGNQDQLTALDGFHLNADGQQLYQSRIANQLATFPLDK